MVALLRPDAMHVINVGDSRAVLGASSKLGRVQPVQLSLDHKPDLPAEKARILAVGGRVLATRNKCVQRRGSVCVCVCVCARFWGVHFPLLPAGQGECVCGRWEGMGSGFPRVCTRRVCFRCVALSPASASHGLAWWCVLWACCGVLWVASFPCAFCTFFASVHRMNPNIVGPMRVWLKDVPAPGLAMSR